MTVSEYYQDSDDGGSFDKEVQILAVQIQGGHGIFYARYGGDPGQAYKLYPLVKQKWDLLVNLPEKFSEQQTIADDIPKGGSPRGCICNHNAPAVEYAG